MTVMARPVERLHPKRVTREVDAVLSLVDNSKGELATEAVHCAFSPLEEGLQDHFSVTVTSHHMAESGELRPECPEVVDLAVVANRPAAVRGAPRLDGTLTVDYFQA